MSRIRQKKFPTGRNALALEKSALVIRREVWNLTAGNAEPSLESPLGGRRLNVQIMAKSPPMHGLHHLHNPAAPWPMRLRG